MYTFRGTPFFLSVVLFVVVPLCAGILTRNHILKTKGVNYFKHQFLPKFGNITILGLLLTLIIIFSFQGDVIIAYPAHIGLIAVPLILQTVLIFSIAYLGAKALQLPHSVAAPAT
nr:hypothetical protein [Rubritalea profundi]